MIGIKEDKTQVGEDDVNDLFTMEALALFRPNFRVSSLFSHYFATAMNVVDESLESTWQHIDTLLSVDTFTANHPGFSAMLRDIADRRDSEGLKLFGRFVERSRRALQIIFEIRDDVAETVKGQLREIDDVILISPDIVDQLETLTPLLQCLELDIDVETSQKGVEDVLTQIRSSLP